MVKQINPHCLLTSVTVMERIMHTFYVYTINRRFKSITTASLARAKHDPKDGIGPRLPIKGVTPDGRVWNSFQGGIPRW